MGRNIKSKHDFEHFVYVQSNKHSNLSSFHLKNENYFFPIPIQLYVCFLSLQIFIKLLLNLFSLLVRIYSANHVIA